MISVKWFGELEFWAALIKVMALVTFLVIGTVFLGGPLQDQRPRHRPQRDHRQRRIAPDGLAAAGLVTTGVVFAYAAVELVGTAAGETGEPGEDHAARDQLGHRPYRALLCRLAGPARRCCCRTPTYKAGESPFVTFFAKIGVEGAGTVMNIVVLTAAFSSLNAGLYSTGRILRSMAMNGSAPKFTSRMTKRGVPYGGILPDRSHRLVRRRCSTVSCPRRRSRSC